MQRFGIGLLLAGVALWSMPSVSMAQNDGCNLNHVPAFCDPGANGVGPEDNCGCDWLDDFEDPQYVVNQFIPVAENEWYGWDDGLTNRGKIADSTERADHTTGTGKSLRAVGSAPGPSTDAVHWFRGRSNVDQLLATGDGAGYDADVSTYWILNGYIFIPTDHAGDSFVILMKTYNRGTAHAPNPGHEWGVEIRFSSATGRVVDDFGDPTKFLPLIKGQWTQLEARINLATDSVSTWYAGQFVSAHSYLRDVGVEYKVIQALDLYVDNGTTTYYDDWSLTASEPPPLNEPGFTCVRDERDDTTGCTEYVWTVTNRNLIGNITQFYLDVAAGSGARYGAGACVGTAASTAAITAPAGWTTTNCTQWNQGHALFRFTNGTPFGPGESRSGRLKIDTNRSVLANDQSAGLTCNAGAGIDVPPYTVLVSAAQISGNEIGAACLNNVYSFGPCFAGPQETDQKWSAMTRCESFLNAPSTSTWAKVVLAMLLVAGGSMLVLRSRRVAA